MKRSILLLLIVLSLKSYAIDYKLAGNLENRISNYTENKNENFGHFTLFNLEQKAIFNEQFLAVNQIRTKSQSIEADLNNKKVLNKKDSFEAYLGENFLRFQNSRLVIQAGLQEVVWGETFGFNYADIITPKDNRITFFSDQSNSRIPILLLNTKFFIEDGSIQLLYSPRPTYSKILPIDLFITDLIPFSKIYINKENNPKFFNQETSEYGGKISKSIWGTDFSLFGYKYVDRDPYFQIASYNSTDLYLNLLHKKVTTYGLSIAKTLADFVLRADVVTHKNKNFNYIQGLNLNSYQANLNQYVISIDTPTYEKYTGFFIFANSKQNGSSIPYSSANKYFVKDEYLYAITRLTRSFEGEKTFELSFTREIKEKGNSIQTQLEWPINNSTILKFGGEFYFGNENSQMSKLKKVNNIFFNIKNFFQL